MWTWQQQLRTSSLRQCQQAGVLMCFTRRHIHKQRHTEGDRKIQNRGRESERGEIERESYGVSWPEAQHMSGALSKSSDACPRLHSELVDTRLRLFVVTTKWRLPRHTVLYSSSNFVHLFLIHRKRDTALSTEERWTKMQLLSLA